MKRTQDYRGLAVAVVLLAVSVTWFFWSSRSVRERREQTLATVPAFPSPGQPQIRRPAGDVRQRAPAPVAPPPPVRARRADPLGAFVLATQGQPVGMLSVNALLNTPLFEHLKECFPADYRHLQEAAGELGMDLDRDLDRVAVAADGVAMSGFFEGKPVAERMMDASRSQHEYRGARVFEDEERCVAQVSTLIVMGKPGHCDALVDRALTPPSENASDELYGDLYFRSDLTRLERLPGNPELRGLLRSMKAVTLRANVWDSVAMTLEATPSSDRDAHDLASMARTAISVTKTQLDEEEVELRTLAELANVAERGDRLEINLALPAKDLFDQFHMPCPGASDGGVERAAGR